MPVDSEKKIKANNVNKIKVTVKNRPTKEEAESRLKRLQEFLSDNWHRKI